MNKVTFAARRIDAFCARLNDGLMAVAIILTIVIAVIFCSRSLPSLLSALQPVDLETGVSLVEF